MSALIRSRVNKAEYRRPFLNPGEDHRPAFVAATTILVVIPGPNVALVVAHSLA